MAETELSAFGRGLQPSWTMHYRAMRESTRGRVGGRGYSGDYWFSGSYRDFVPDHYRVGYQMVRWSYDHFDKFIWDDIARYVSRNPQTIMPTIVGLRKKYDLTPLELFRRTFTDLNAYWDSLPEVEDSSMRIATPETSYTAYEWPLWLDDNTLVVFKTDFDRPSRIVKVDTATGKEKILTYTGVVSSRPVLSDGLLLWTEYRSSTLWAEKTDSHLCTYDLATGHKKVHSGDRQIFFPTPTDKGIAFVEYDYSGQFSISRNDECTLFPRDIEITGLAWDDVTGRLYFIGLDDGGMFIGKIGDAKGEDDATFESNWDRLTPSRHITISDLRADNGRLYFGSIASGRDEAHAYDLATGTEYRLSESAYGSFQPSPSAGGGKIALTTYDHRGYHLAIQDTAEATVQEQRELPVDLVNPQWKRWDIPKMDSLVYSETTAIASEAKFKPRRYSRVLNILHPHSWLPVNFYPPAAIQEADLMPTLGATIMSQSLLSDATTWLAYGWDHRGGSMVRGGFSYNGLGPVLDVDFTWGGDNQTVHSDIPEGIDIELKRYFSIATRLSLPMTLSSGHWMSAVSPSAEYFYDNGLIFRTWDKDTEGKVKLTHGIERLTFGLVYSGQTRLAKKEFLPRWGFGAKAAFVVNPTNSDFRKIALLSLRGNFPGAARPHSTTLRMAWQESLGDDNAVMMFQMKEVFPRGARYDLGARRWASGSLDYQLPVWYPEGGWPSIIYFKRVRVNVFADYARWQDFSGKGSGINNAGKWRPLFSYGGDIILDVNPFRMPGGSNVSVRVTVAKPSDSKSVFVGYGIEVPL
jgi:hypothetical protein